MAVEHAEGERMMQRVLVTIITLTFFLANSLQAVTLNSTQVYNRPGSFYVGKIVPDQLSILNIISIVPKIKRHQKIPNESAGDYVKYIDNKTIELNKIDKFLKLHYEHLLINVILLEMIEAERLILPFGLSLNKDFLILSKKKYTKFFKLIQEHYLSKEFINYNEKTPGTSTIRDFLPIYNIAYRKAQDIAIIETDILENIEIMEINYKDDLTLQSSLNKFYKDVNSVKKMMPYKNLPNHLLDIILQGNKMLLE